MLRPILILFLTVMSSLPALANPRWKMHTTFDGTVDNVFETPEYVYFTSRAMDDMSGQRRMSLFRYDKEGDEIQALSPDNLLSSTTISAVQYCPQKGYVVAVNTNYDVTFIYDNGKVVTIPDYRLAHIDGEKTINSITIDPWHNRLYLATKFGYVALNDEKYEIAESRIYKENIKAVARIGNQIALFKDANLLYAPVSSPRLSLDDYQVADYSTPFAATPLSETQCLVFTNGGGPHNMLLVEEKGDDLESRLLLSGNFLTMTNNKNGVFASNNTTIWQVLPDGSVTKQDLPADLQKYKTGTYDMSEIWFGKERLGVKSAKLGGDSSEWTVTRDFMIPNAPSPFATSVMALHPKGEALITTYPADYTCGSYPPTPQMLVSGYENGWWSNYAPAYTLPERPNMRDRVNGVAVDPDNSDYIYLSTYGRGFFRLNLNDSNDIIHLSKPSDKDNGQSGFLEFVPDFSSTDYKDICNFSAPKFDNDGNIWMTYAAFEDQDPVRIHAYCWEAADRKATTSAADIKLPKHVEWNYTCKLTNMTTLLPLRHSKNKNLLLYSSRAYDNDIAVIDTNGTPTDPSDDKMVTLKTFIDQEGNAIETYRLRSFWEDPSTGNVWVCHSTGVFYIDPSDFFKDGIVKCNRIKVSRNDGTNLADYLLHGVIVNGLTIDGKGRKWFSTVGGGLVCTSSDGRTVEEEFNVSNSPIPSDDVYGALYIPSSNSLLISTSEGIAEYYLTSDVSSSTENDIKIYPNPVRPDYFGYVTIEGLPDRSLLKIVDASGNIVKEFGPISGDVQWDVTNHQYKRVSSGVYFVLASAGENESAFSTVGKILVVN